MDGPGRLHPDGHGSLAWHGSGRPSCDPCQPRYGNLDWPLVETPLTPLEFMRRSRRLYPNREAVVDRERRLTYAQFFDRCDRWSAALQQLGVGPGDRVAYIAPNILPQLESFYAVPQLAAVDSIRPQLKSVQHFVALQGRAGGWLDYERTLAAHEPVFATPPDISEHDLLTINYTSGTTARPKGVMISHRNAWMNVVGTLIHLTLHPGDRYLWTLPMFHANGWSYVWVVTAAGATHICLPKVEPAAVFQLVRDERVGWMCAAPTVLIALANAPPQVGGEVPPGVHIVTAGAPPAAATIERLEDDLGWEVTQVYGLTETSPFITVCEPLPEHAALSR